MHITVIDLEIPNREGTDCPKRGSVPVFFFYLINSLSKTGVQVSNFDALISYIGSFFKYPLTATYVNSSDKELKTRQSSLLYLGMLYDHFSDQWKSHIHL